MLSHNDRNGCGTDNTVKSSIRVLGIIVSYLTLVSVQGKVDLWSYIMPIVRYSHSPLDTLQRCPGVVKI